MKHLVTLRRNAVEVSLEIPSTAWGHHGITPESLDRDPITGDKAQTPDNERARLFLACQDGERLFFYVSTTRDEGGYLMRQPAQPQVGKTRGVATTSIAFGQLEAEFDLNGPTCEDLVVEYSEAQQAWELVYPEAMLSTGVPAILELSLEQVVPQAPALPAFLNPSGSINTGKATREVIEAARQLARSGRKVTANAVAHLIELRYPEGAVDHGDMRKVACKILNLDYSGFRKVSKSEWVLELETA